MLLESSLSSSVWKGYFKKQCFLISAESSLLSLASTKTVDGIFYCSVLKTPVDDRDLYIARYFEYSTFNGYFENVVSNDLKQSLDIIAYCIYTSKDNDREGARHLSMYQDQRKVMFLHFLSLKRNLFRLALA